MKFEGKLKRNLTGMFLVDLDLIDLKVYIWFGCIMIKKSEIEVYFILFIFLD